MTRLRVNIYRNHVFLFFPPTAVLNMDNSVVDMETLHALYENVSIMRADCYIGLELCRHGCNVKKKLIDNLLFCFVLFFTLQRSILRQRL